MKVYVVEEYLNDYPENGAAFRASPQSSQTKQKQLNFANRLAFLKIMNPQRVKPIMNM